MVNVAINGLGRIGRATLKIILESSELNLLAINDLVSIQNLAYLLKYDSVFGRYEKPISIEGNTLCIDGANVTVYNSKDPAELPWKDLGIEIVFECTGKFTKKEELKKHLTAGANAVILSAPSKDEIETVVSGVNQQKGMYGIISCASCTTNCITPVFEIVQRRIGVQKALLTTVHAYTSSQHIVDSPDKKFARGRAGASNIVPTTTGAAIATTEVLPEFRGKFDGLALRVPVINGSIADITFLTSRNTSVEELQTIFTEECSSERYRQIISVSKDPLVSCDIIKDPHAAIIDLGLVKVVDGNLVKIMSWYDNEWGYSSQMVREAIAISKSLRR